LVRGDAGQRALAAASMGWAPAQAAAGTAWMPPFLAAMLDDPYSAVRFTAARALRTLPGFASVEYDPVGTPSEWRRAQVDTVRRWRSAPAPSTARPELLFTAADAAALRALQGERDDRPVSLRE